MRKEINLSENENLLEDVYEQILNDRELFNDFMVKMMQNEQAVGWMIDHEQMMGTMFSEQNMMDLMHNHPNMVDLMMDNMMDIAREDSAVARHWGDMMMQDENMRKMMEEYE